MLNGDDERLLARLYALLGADDDAFVAEMLGAFLEDLPAFLQRIGAALQQQDFSELQQATHHLRSGAHALGGVGIAAAAMPLEAAAREGDPVRAQVQWPFVLAEAERYRHTAQALLERLALR